MFTPVWMSLESTTSLHLGRVSVPLPIPLLSSSPPTAPEIFEDVPDPQV